MIAAGESVIPVEVKSGATGQLRSMRAFLDARESVARYGVRFSAQNFSVLPHLRSYPVYAVASVLSALDRHVHSALRSLL